MVQTFGTFRFGAKMKIAIFGTGGVGGYFGGRLAQSGQDVVFIARGEHRAAIAGHGLRVEARTAISHPPGGVVEDLARPTWTLSSSRRRPGR
jgi:2-dehydropantoate 2-reductase